jgi:hypothetical protein
MTVFQIKRNNAEERIRLSVLPKSVTNSERLALILTAIVSEELKDAIFVMILVFVGISVSCWGFFSLVSKLQRTLSNFKIKKGEDF